MSAGIAVALAIFAAGSFATVLFGVVCLVCAPFARVLIEKATFGTGPRMFRGRVGATVIEVNLVPILSSVMPSGASVVGGNEADGRARLAPPNVPWFEASRWRRILVFFGAPRLTTFAFAAAVIGPGRAARASVVGLIELLSGAVAPFSTARAILDKGAGVFAREGFGALYALALCKWLSVGLLAIPTDLAFAAATKHRDGLGKTRAALMLLTFFVYAAWIVAWIGWIAR